MSRMSTEKKEGLFEKIKEHHEERKEEREAERELAKEEPNKKQRAIDDLDEKTDAYEDDVAFASEEILNEET